MSALGIHASALCAVCNTTPTNHRCLHPMKRGLLEVNVIGKVCGKAICGPCNIHHGNEGVYQCPLHSTLDDNASEDLEEEQGNDKENVPVISVQSVNVSRAKVAKVSVKATKGAEYGAKDLLILSQAFIRTSENAVEGTAKQSNKFWDEVAISYSALKKQQEAYNN
jgi:hypothetical protein